MTIDTDTLAAVWTALSSVLRTEAPEPRVIEAWRDPALLDQWPLLDPELGPVGQRARDGIDELRSSTEELQDILDDQFRLIRGPGQPIAVPWESVHRSSEGLLFEDETMQVRAFYRRFGLEAPRLDVEPDDHISLELDFLVELLKRSMAASDAGDVAEAQRHREAHDEFCSSHLLQWAPTFFRTITEHADTRFYKGIGLLGEDACERVAAALPAQ